MSQVFDRLFGQYSDYLPLDITLEITGVIFGLVSVICAKKNNVFVYPTGMFSTAIFVYLLFKWFLLGDMLINAYYFIMSAYGWYYWSQKKEDVYIHKVDFINTKERQISIGLFFLSLCFVFGVYQVFDRWNDWTAYIDTLTTAVFFVGMWLMARRKVENWIFWIVGDLISIPLYFHKGLTITSLQYLIFTVIAIYGYRAWKKILNKSLPTS
ncbi:MAG: nicotinamide mononucleotide transporter [Flavobacteriaceae bacterium]|nr:nicotinamide mononucleotide transporter [Flavobacteriaceae bacterium]|tara:strand:+ start:898 stop:1530 length:633 start_codon:yes stop_codon:yes gene_type:complete